MNLIQAARCALADLAGMYWEGGLGIPQKKTLVELFDALSESGENVGDFQDEYEAAKDDVAEVEVAERKHHASASPRRRGR